MGCCMHSWMEENEAVRMSCCWEGWVCGWVGKYLSAGAGLGGSRVHLGQGGRDECLGAGAEAEEGKAAQGAGKRGHYRLSVGVWIGGVEWVGGWVGGWEAKRQRQALV